MPEPQPAALAASVATFREEYRRAEIPVRYRGWVHFAFTTGASLGAIIFSLWRVHAPAAWELALVPLYFVLANAAEYFGHKGPMHHPRAGLRKVFERHTLMHHHFFTEDAMACESARDFQIMLFPPVLLLFFLGGIAAPIGAALFLAVSANAGWLFVATGMGYFLLYEWLHFCYHLPSGSAVGRLALVRALRRHHAAHHDLAKMARFNFNITFPIFDAILGTTFRPPAS